MRQDNKKIKGLGTVHNWRRLWGEGESIHWKTNNTRVLRGVRAVCQFIFRWIHIYDSKKSTWLESRKLHLCAVLCTVRDW